MNKIKVIIKKPGKKPYITHISDTLLNLQKTVGGDIEAVTLASGVVAICDVDGFNKGYPFCCFVHDIGFFGTIVIAGYDSNGSFTGLPDDEYSKKIFRYLGDEDLYIDFFDPDCLFDV